jgi:hypothetical protein
MIFRAPTATFESGWIWCDSRVRIKSTQDSRSYVCKLIDQFYDSVDVSSSFG